MFSQGDWSFFLLALNRFLELTSKKNLIGLSENQGRTLVLSTLSGNFRTSLMFNIHLLAINQTTENLCLSLSFSLVR